MASISIIGAGPSGNYSAYLLAKKGHDVNVYEEHPEIGKPWACTGVITEDVLSRQFKIPDNLIVNRIEKARIISPNSNRIEVKLKNDIIIDRAGFDLHLAEMAKNAGAKYFVNHRFLEIEKNDGKVIAKIKNKNLDRIKTIEADYLIGTDGPRSEVAKSAGLFGNRQFYIGQQVTAEFENDNAIEFFPSKEGIAWVVPDSKKTVRAGIAARENASSYFDNFMKTAIGKNYREKITGHQAGPIPLYDPKQKAAKGRVFLAGDAAGMVKAPTLGGINQGIIAATAVCDAIETGQDYQKLWKSRLGKDLWISLMMRKIMNKFDDSDYNKLVSIFTREKNRKLLEKFDRDEPSRFAIKLLMQEPRLLLLCAKIML